MAERFQKLFSLKPNLFSEGCPILIEKGALYKDIESGSIIVLIKMRNIGENPIKSCKIYLNAYENNGNEVETITEFSYLDLNVGLGEKYGDKTPIILSNRIARSFTVGINEIVFTNGTISDCRYEKWKEVPKQDSLEKVLADEEMIKQYRMEVGVEANYYPEKKEGFFLCTCGAINYESAKKCYNCGWSYDSLINKIDKDYLSGQIEKRNASKREKNEKRRRLIKIIIVVAIAVSILIAGICGVINIKEKKLESEVCSSVVGKSYYSDRGQTITFHEDYLYDGANDLYYGIKRIGLKKYAIDIAVSSEDDLFENGDYLWVVTKRTGTQIVEFDNPNSSGRPYVLEE